MNVFPPTPDTPGDGKHTVYSSHMPSTAGTSMATPQTSCSLSTRASSNDVSSSHPFSKTERLKQHLQFWKNSKPSAADVQYSWESVERAYAKYLEALQKSLKVTNAWTDHIVPTIEETFEGSKDYSHVLEKHEQTAYYVKQLVTDLINIAENDTLISENAKDIAHHFHGICQYEKAFYETKRKQERADHCRRQLEYKYKSTAEQDKAVKRCAANTFKSLNVLTERIDREILQLFEGLASRLRTIAQNDRKAHYQIDTRLCECSPYLGGSSKLVGSRSMHMDLGTGFPSPAAAANPAVGRTQTRGFPGQVPMNDGVRYESVNSSIYSTDFAEEPAAQFHSHLTNGAHRTTPEELMHMSESVETMRLESDTPVWDGRYN